MNIPGAASAHQATQEPIESQAQNELQAKMDALMNSVSTKHQNRFPRPPTEADEDAWANWEGKCVSECSKAAKQKEQIVQLLRQKDSIAARRHIQTMYNSNQKQWNNRVLKGDTNDVTLNAVLNKSTGQMLNDPDITEYVHEAFQQQARPADGRTKTRKYLPEEAKRDYPWEAAYSNIDPYTLETKVGQPEYGEFSLLDHVRDPSLYHQQVSRLPNRKSAGPDSIPSKLLKHLPEAAHMAIHKLFVLMWMAGHTPTAWKESCTVLIHKKGEAFDLGNWRPIALANTIYKLWTSMVTQCLTKHAEHYDILSSSQEGFRSEENTINSCRT